MSDGMEERVFIAGAGPVGLVAAASLISRGVPVTVFEAGATLSEESRASTFHPPTLDMLDTLGAAEPLIAQGLIAPRFQYRARQGGPIGRFDFAALADETAHPYRLQCEQSKLTRILYEQLKANPLFAIEFGSRVRGAHQNDESVELTIEHSGATHARRAPWLIAADGARSDVRRALDISFEGFTWPERFLVVSTPFDFPAVMDHLDAVSYVADPERWHFLLQIPGLWRVMFPIRAEESDELALDADFAQSLLANVTPESRRYEIAHLTLYKVHQRVAATFRKGRALLVGDAAHINNPLGGMGMNGGIHDAMNLTPRLAAVWHGEAPDEELDRFDRQRRLVTAEYIEQQSIRNKRNLESADGSFARELAEIGADPARTRDYLMRVSMLWSLKRASELG